MDLLWHENGKVLEVGMVVEQHLWADICHMQLTRHQPELFHRPRAPCGAITDEPCRFFMPFIPKVIDSVLKHPGYPMVIFPGHEDVRIERGNLL
jgi:hypothetical protein